MIEKECEICGTWFSAEKSTRRFCDKCQKDSTKAQVYMDKNYTISRARIGDDYFPTTVNCSICGKEIQVPMKWKDHSYHVCSQKCLSIYRAENKPVRIKKPAPINKCKGCGKEFEGKNVYCSKECYLNDIKKHKNENNVIGDVTLTCKVCGKQFTIHKDKLTPKSDLPKCCSVECRKHAQLVGARKGGNTLSVKKKEIKSQLLVKDVKANGLCGYCKTPYTDCERMQTNFRVIPKGAKFNNNGKIIQCPKFKK